MARNKDDLVYAENIVRDIFGVDFNTAKDLYADNYFGHLQLLIS